MHYCHYASFFSWLHAGRARAATKGNSVSTLRLNKTCFYHTLQFVLKYNNIRMSVCVCCVSRFCVIHVLETKVNPNKCWYCSIALCALAIVFSSIYYWAIDDQMETGGKERTANIQRVNRKKNLCTHCSSSIYYIVWWMSHCWAESLNRRFFSLSLCLCRQFDSMTSISEY